MNWRLWAKQIAAIVRLEMRKQWVGRRSIAVYLLAMAPSVLLLIAIGFGAYPPRRRGPSFIPVAIYAVFFQTFWLRLAIFFSCGAVFSQLFRGEILEKTLHYYLLAPVRREVVIAAKYLSALSSVFTAFGLTTISSYLLFFGPSPQFSNFFFNGPGLSNLALYVFVVLLACMGYGALFLLIGLIFRNPMTPAVFVILWESFSFAMPKLFQKISITYYLQPWMPVPVPLGPFAIIAEPTSAALAMPALLFVTVALLGAASYRLRRTEVTYSVD